MATKWIDKRLEQAWKLIQEVSDEHNNPETDIYSSLHHALECVEEADCDLENAK